MTAPQPATPGSDGEVCACGHPQADHTPDPLGPCVAIVDPTDPGFGRWDDCMEFTPAAPAEPPAADSPTPGTETWVSPFPPFGTTPSPRPVVPSPVGTTEPPAETQQDDERDVQVEAIAKAVRESAEFPITTEDWAEALYDTGIRSLAARPSADAETLREQVETWIDEAPEQTAGLDLLRQIIGRPR